MASPDQVKQYLAYWFQLGKSLIVPGHVPDPFNNGQNGNSSQNGATQPDRGNHPINGYQLPQGQSKYLPQSVIQGDRYSPEFEACWQKILSGIWKDSYLEGTAQTIEQLLSSQWDISNCARCTMPVPMLSLGVKMGDTDCPCSDLPGWPNTDLPQPRDPINSYRRLGSIRDRLSQN